MNIFRVFLLSFSIFTPAICFSNIYEKDVCSSTTKVCAFIQSELPFTSKSEGRFKLNFKDGTKNEINLVKIDLWMQMGNHGHGSSPLKVASLGPSQYDITNAYFVMRGTWQIRMTYKQNDVQETLILPIQINE